MRKRRPILAGCPPQEDTSISNTVFPFAFLRPPAADYAEATPRLEEVERSEGGWTAAINRAQDSMFRCSGTIRLPDSSGNLAGDFLGFVDDRSGVVDSFLYLPVLYRNRTFIGRSLGTGTGSKTAFPFADAGLHRHVVNGDHSDPVTLKVYKAGVLQTITTHYTVSGNDSNLTVTFVAAPALAAAITVDYEAYAPVRFASTEFGDRVLSRKKSDEVDAEEVVEFSVSLAEDRPGRRYAT